MYGQHLVSHRDTARIVCFTRGGGIWESHFIWQFSLSNVKKHGWVGVVSIISYAWENGVVKWAFHFGLVWCYNDQSDS